jgi:hypothetical protein
MVVDAGGRAFVGCFGFDLMGGALVAVSLDAGAAELPRPGIEDLDAG